MKKLKEIRIKNNITVHQMAVALGLSEPFYSQIENKKRKLSYENAKKIAAIFNMKPDDLFYDEF